MLKRYSVYSFNPVDYRCKFDSIVYDDIVDRTSFVIDSESVRNNVLSGSSSSLSLQYDGDDLPSDFVVSVRQGKLDKAEVYQAQLKMQDDIKKDIDSAKKVGSSDSGLISDTQASVIDSSSN